MLDSDWLLTHRLGFESEKFGALQEQQVDSLLRYLATLGRFKLAGLALRARDRVLKIAI